MFESNAAVAFCFHKADQKCVEHMRKEEILLSALTCLYTPKKSLVIIVSLLLCHNEVQQSCFFFSFSALQKMTSLIPHCPWYLVLRALLSFSSSSSAAASVPAAVCTSCAASRDVSPPPPHPHSHDSDEQGRGGGQRAVTDKGEILFLLCSYCMMRGSHALHARRHMAALLRWSCTWAISDFFFVVWSLCVHVVNLWSSLPMSR